MSYDPTGNGTRITELHESSVYRAGEDGLQHRSAWAGAGDGVQFYDADGEGKISDRREYVFTDWAPGAGDDMEALGWAFDSNGDGVFNPSDVEWSSFKVEVTGADGRTKYFEGGHVPSMNLPAQFPHARLPLRRLFNSSRRIDLNFPVGGMNYPRNRRVKTTLPPSHLSEIISSGDNQ